jgi:lysophospholipase L1-like esterase
MRSHHPLAIALPALLTAVTTALTITVASVITAGRAAAAAAEVHYVALGDSYSSGYGAGGYDSSSGNCYRSRNSYASKWAAANSPTSFAFVACSGATTSSVISRQLGALRPSTTLVTITVGGNDVGFASVMQTCVLQSTSSCQAAVGNAKNLASAELPGRLSDLFARIRSAAPSARIVVMDYPRLYTITSGCAGLNNTKRAALNSGADHLDDVIGKSTVNAGHTFADVRGQFNGHELCSGDGWLRAVTVPIGESYHPTALGQSSGYLPVLSRND